MRSWHKAIRARLSLGIGFIEAFIVPRLSRGKLAVLYGLDRPVTSFVGPKTNRRDTIEWFG